MVPTGQFSEELRVFEQRRQDWAFSHPGEFVSAITQTPSERAYRNLASEKGFL
jgi:hypothetical protein